jgi:hypothetical protein
MAASLLGRFQGSLVGAIVGDCIGAVFEGFDWSTVVGTDRVLKLVEKIETGNLSDIMIISYSVFFRRLLFTVFTVLLTDTRGPPFKLPIKSFNTNEESV